MTRKSLLAACLACLAAPAAAESFRYTYVEAGLGLVSLEEDLVLFNEVYEDFGLFYAGGGFQLHDNVAIEVSAGVLGNEGDRTEITESAIGISVLFPIAITDSLSLAPRIGHQSYELELCRDNTCMTADERDAVYGVGLRAWALPGQLEITAELSDSTATESDTFVGVGAALWFDNHSLRLKLGETEFQTQFSVGYRYSW